MDCEKDKSLTKTLTKNSISNFRHLGSDEPFLKSKFYFISFDCFPNLLILGINNCTMDIPYAQVSVKTSSIPSSLKLSEELESILSQEIPSIQSFELELNVR